MLGPSPRVIVDLIDPGYPFDHGKALSVDQDTFWADSGHHGLEPGQKPALFGH